MYDLTDNKKCNESYRFPSVFGRMVSPQSQHVMILSVERHDVSGPGAGGMCQFCDDFVLSGIS